MKKESTTKQATKATTKTVSTTRRIKKSKTGRPPRYKNIFLFIRLYVRAAFLGFRRGKSTQTENHALIKIEGLNERKEVNYYQGKRVVYIYKTQKGFRVI